MDVDRFIADNRARWDRTADLATRAAGRRGRRRLTPDEISELVDGYQLTSLHLSMVRTAGVAPELSAHLTDVVARASAAIHGSRRSRRAGLVDAVTVTVPAALWRIRWFSVAAAVLMFGPALALGTWLAVSPAALDAAAPEAARALYVDEQFAAYYSSEPASEFASSVFINNARVGALAFALGVLAMVPTAVVLAFNGANIGLAGGLFVAAGEPGRFFGLILPHGLLELSAVVFAGGAGLALGWAWLVPGDETRSASLARAGRQTVAVVGGLVPVFGVAGLIEGFVTPSSLSTAARVGIGVVAAALFYAYVGVAGRAAHRDLATS